MVPELRGGQEPPQHQRADGHPARLRQRGAGRRARAGGPGRGGDRERHRRAAGREGAHRRRRARGRLDPEHLRAHGREPAARGPRGRRDPLRLHQHERPDQSAHDKGIRRVHRLQDPGPCGERLLAQVEVRGLHLQVCARLHARGLHRGAGAGGAAAAGAPALPRPARGVGDVDLPRADVPGHLLPVRAGHQHPALLLCGHRRGEQRGRPRQGLQLPGDALQDARRGL